jgi:hypothetical protein
MRLHSTYFIGALGAASAALCFALALAVPAAIVGTKPASGVEPKISDSMNSETVNRAAKGDRLRVIVRPPGSEPFDVQVPVPAGSSPRLLDGCESAFGQMDHSSAAKLARDCVT